jgi:putative ABC transport system permease protein
MLRQIFAVTAMNLRGMRARLAASSVVVIGLAAVVGVLVAVFTMAGGLQGTLLENGRADRAIVLRTASTYEAGSTLPLDTAAYVAAAPGVVRASDGKLAVTSDVLVSVNWPRREDGSLVGLQVRGVAPAAFAVRPEIELVEGRLFMPGLREVVVGRNAQTEFAGLMLGDRVKLRNSEWTIVGVFMSGNAVESGFLTDADTLASAYQRGYVNSVTARLESPAAFDAFAAALKSNPALTIDVFREPDYFALASEDLANLFFFVTYVVCSIMAAGALVGAGNTMYSAVSSRAVEIATLRALGFGAAGVVVSVLAESLLLAVVGATIGSAIAWAIFSGDTISIGGGSGSIVTQLAFTPATIVTGFTWAGAVALLGALLPAARAARVPVATALRAL